MVLLFFTHELQLRCFHVHSDAAVYFCAAESRAAFTAVEPEICMLSETSTGGVLVQSNAS